MIARRDIFLRHSFTTSASGASLNAGQIDVSHSPTRLTQNRKRQAKGIANDGTSKTAKHPQAVCLTCGKEIAPRRRYCPTCAIPAATEHIKQVAQAALGRAQSPEALAKNAETQRQRRKVQAAWS